MKRKIISGIGAALFALFAASAGDAEQITKVGVVDLTKVFNAYTGASGPGRELVDYWSETDAQLGKITKEITELEVLREKAKKDNDDRAVLDYDKQISEKKEYQRDYYRYRKLEYDKKYDALMKSSGFYSEMLKVIEFIAVRDSYSVILKTSDPSLMYYSKNVDITQDVIDYIK
jgi:outer membrane protein